MTTRCGSCGADLPKHEGSGAPRKHCDNDRCGFIYYAPKSRVRCARCPTPLPRGKGYQRMAICMPCYLDLGRILGAAVSPRA